MTHRFDRRSVLRLVGATTAVWFAGCGGTQSGSEPNTETIEPSTTDGSDPAAGEPPGDGSETAAGGGQSLTVTEVEVDVGEDLTLRGVLGDELLITGEKGGGEVVNYGGRTEGPYDGIEGDFVPVKGGIAYLVLDTVEENGTRTREWVIISGGEELFRKSDGERPRLGDVGLYDSLDGDLLWVDHKDQPGTVRHGEEAIETGYGEVEDVTAIGGEIGYIGVEMGDEYAVGNDVKIGTETVAELDRSAYQLTDIDGQPAYVKSTNKGDAVIFNGREVGTEYTTRRDGDFKDVFELDGRLAFIASVAAERMENSEREQEQVLWHDGEEIGRHDRIRAPNHSDVGPNLTYVDGKICYLFTDEQGTAASDGAVYGGVMYGGELLEPGRETSLVVDVDGTPAYSVGAGDGKTVKVVYGDRETATYEAVGQPVEAGGTLYFPADVDGERTIFQVQ